MFKHAVQWGIWTPPGAIGRAAAVRTRMDVFTGRDSSAADAQEEPLRTLLLTAVLRDASR
jgi:hypothetical protein